MLRSWLHRHHAAVTIAGSLLVAAALAFGLWGKRTDFAAALQLAPLWILAAAILLHIAWLVARSEAWHVCVGAAGGDVERRRLYRAAAVGYLGNLFNSSFGLGVRIAALRRSAPVESPGVGVLITAEMPIVVIEIALAAICSFTLVGPLNIPWWTPIIALAVAGGIVYALTRLADKKRDGVWKGIAVMRGLRHRNLIIALTIGAVLAQVFRNWLVLKGIGIDVTILDSVALLVASAAIGLLPVGPSLGITSSILILGSKGVAAVAAAGALLTATGAVGALCFASWALADRFRTRKAEAEAAEAVSERPSL